MTPLIPTLIATFLISLGGLVGAVTLLLQQRVLSKILFFLVSLSAGTLMGGAFLHLLPEAAEELAPDVLFPWVLGAFILFFLIEKLLHWHHCHREDCDRHVLGHMNLIGDALHNLLDGILIGAAFTVEFELGVATAVAVAVHEIPQEVSDFGVLLHSGWEKRRALLANFAVALFAVLGGVFGVIAGSSSEALAHLLVPFAAGGFLYIAASDLLPEIRREKHQGKAWASFATFLLGIGVMYVLTFFEAAH